MLKRTLDICVSFLGLGILAIPFLLISLLIRLETPGSPIYWSKRIGRFGSIHDAKISYDENRRTRNAKQ